MKKLLFVIMFSAIALLMSSCGVVSGNTVRSAGYDAGMYIGSKIYGFDW